MSPDESKRVSEPKLKEATESPTLRTDESEAEPGYPDLSVDGSFKIAAVLPVAQESLVDEVLDQRYKLGSIIGSGASSTVYLAHDLQTNHSAVAIKVLYKHLCADAAFVNRFLREAKTASILVHPNIARVLGCGQTQSGQPYHVLELVEGQNLQQLMHSGGGSLPWRRAAGIFRQICAALAAAHQHGIVHRDIKPTNIMVCQSEGGDIVKVLDFGIAKLLPAQGDTYFRVTQTCETLGSLLYMSPEQCLDENIDERSDVYSLGCVMYEAVTGQPAFSGRTAFLTMNQHLTAQPESFTRVRPELGLPAALQSVVFRALATKPSDRYQTIGELADALQDVELGNSLAVSPANLIPPQSPRLPAKAKVPKTVLCAVTLLYTHVALGLVGLVESLHVTLTPLAEATRYRDMFLVLIVLMAVSFLTFKISQGNQSARISFGSATIGFFIMGILAVITHAPNLDVGLWVMATVGVPPMLALALLHTKSASAWFDSFQAETILETVTTETVTYVETQPGQLPRG